ncbi:MAG: hypothetical protein M5U01_21035 [Ardenticatenaceae bacterium]|nr:hypothetical protein [Ardenticatenaceae bacterium]HBY98867.1 hypothetical protein [Chloroflexota bacterium]
MIADTRPWLIAADWQSRALLLAELEARGIEMRAEPGMRWAMRALLRERLRPRLILIDPTGDSDATPPEVERLLAVLGENGVQPSLIFLVSAFERALWEQSFGERATILVRPRTIGEIAEVVCGRLAHG